MKKDKDSNILLSANNFIVVGIGASAGGLDAFKKLLKAIPENSGMAYVLVQHLDPRHESLLPELLQKVTTIPVLEILDDIRVEPDHIYVIPSNKMMVANDGILQLTPRPGPEKNTRNLPIDLFFTSLAIVHQSYAIGVVLSGTASDGTLGLKAIKDQGGITFAQDEDSAAFKGMPHNAAIAGVVDFILPPGEIPGKIMEVSKTINNKSEQDADGQLDEIYKKILTLLRIRKGTDFTYYKQPTIRRRILRRMALNKLDTYETYLKYLRENRTEQDALYQDLLIPVTAFFRDEKVFDHLCVSILPLIAKNKPPGQAIRVWVAGCSTGEEAYSVAICLKEFIGKDPVRIQIFGTDISEPAIAKARTGIYNTNDLKAVSDQRKQAFFTKTNTDYQVKKEIRDLCVFAVHDFLRDPPFSKMDIVSCRNVLIYMEPYLQKKALATFHYSLQPNGFLLLGRSETSTGMPELFLLTARQEKIFSKKDVPGRFIPMAHQRSEKDATDASVLNKEILRSDFQKTADEIILSKYPPAGVIVNELLDIVNFRGNTGNYLEQLPGKPSHNLLKMARQGLGFELRNLLHKAKKEKVAILKENIPLQVNGIICHVTIEAIPIPNTLEPYYLVLFKHTPAAPQASTAAFVENSQKITKTNTDAKDLRIRHLEQELAQTHEDMRNITDDQETTNEELQSDNEELLSTSEELQSLNEELETSKEELQSTNEELTVVNQEVVNLNEQVTEALDYAEAIIATVRKPLLVLDKNLFIKTANSAYYQLFAVRPADTIGVLFYECNDGRWNIPELRNWLEKILPEKSSFQDFETEFTTAHRGKQVLQLNARQLVKESGAEKLILLAIEDVTESKNQRQKENAISLRFQNLVEKAPYPICILKGENMVLEVANDPVLKVWNVGREVIGKPFLEIIPEMKDQPFMGWLLEVLHKGVTHYGSEELAYFNSENRDPQKLYFNFVYQPYHEDDGSISGVMVLANDVSEQVLYRKKLEAQAALTQNLLMTAPGFVCTLTGPDHVYQMVNKRYQQLFGDRKIKGKPILEALPELRGQGFDLLLDHVYNTGEPYVGIDIPMMLARDESTAPVKCFFNFSYQPMYNEDGNIFSILVFGYEVTEQVNARNIILEMQLKHTSELEEKVALRTLELSNANESLQEKNQEIALSQYNKRFFSEFSQKFSHYKHQNDFFSSLVQFIADTTHLDYVFVGMLQHNADGSSKIQTIALSAFGELAANFSYDLADGPCEQVISGKLCGYPKMCTQIFPKNKTIIDFKIEGHLGYPLNDEQGNAVGLIAVMHREAIEESEMVSEVLKTVGRRAEIEMEREKYSGQLAQTVRSLKEKNDELLKANKELLSFTYISSHDLQEPLRKIETFLNLITEKEKQNLSEKGKHYLSRVQLSADRMRRLIEDLLVYSQTNTQDRTFENTSLNSIVAQVMTDLSEMIQDKNVTISVGELDEVKIVRFQFVQIFNNLLSNSIKFSMPGIPLRMTINSKIISAEISANPNLAAGTTYCQITVTDNGIGFDPQYKDKIFEVFQQLNGKDEYPGTGIGLAIVQKIVENHNGFITATGEVNNGASFDIYIPAA